MKATDIYKNVKDGVVAIRTNSGSGSGVVVGEHEGEYEVVTNCHVIDDGGPIRVGLVTPSGKWKPVEAHVISADLRDLCLLRAKGLSAKPLTAGSAKNLKPGDTVYAMGAPEMLPLTLSAGVVSQLRGNNLKLPPIIQTDVSISPGSSGGGLFNEKGELIGIPFLSHGGGQNLNFALPVDWIADLRKDAGVEEPIRQRWRECLSHIEKGNMSKIPDIFSQMANTIVSLRSNPQQKSATYGKIVREEARAGRKDISFADTFTGWENAAKSANGKDRVNFEAAWCYACVGNFSKADKTVKRIKGDKLKLAAYAVISAEQARSGDAAVARKRLRGENLHEKGEEKTLWLLAWGLAEVGRVKEALECVEKIQESDDFVGVTRALSSVAGSLARQGCDLGAGALFRFMHSELARNEKVGGHMGRGERVLSLGLIAWEEAECGGAQAKENARKSMQEAMKIVSEGGIDHEGYGSKIEALSRIAQIAAKARNPMAALWAIQRVPVLSDDFAVALAYVAIALKSGE